MRTRDYHVLPLGTLFIHSRGSVHNRNRWARHKHTVTTNTMDLTIYFIGVIIGAFRPNCYIRTCASPSYGSSRHLQWSPLFIGPGSPHRFAYSYANIALVYCQIMAYFAGHFIGFVASYCGIYCPRFTRVVRIVLARWAVVSFWCARPYQEIVK